MKFENMYFIIGTAYAGKSTMVKRLAEKHGGIACEENYHNARLEGLGHPLYCYLGGILCHGTGAYLFV